MSDIQTIIADHLQARLPLSVSSYQIRCVAEEIAQAIEARSAETGHTDSARQGESAVPQGMRHDNGNQQRAKAPKDEVEG